MKDLLEIRKEIDLVDDEINKLFTKRMNLAKEVAEYKKNVKKGVTDNNRENDILVRLFKNSPEEYQMYLKQVYSTIFSVSRSYQNTLISSTSSIVEKIKDAINTKNNKISNCPTVACQGVSGANSEKATKLIFPVSEISYFKTFESVFMAVDKGLCEYGVLPIDNTTAGSVLEVYDLMKKYNFYIIGSKKIRINHCLASIDGASKNTIKKVYSHQQALSQCSNYLKTNNFAGEPKENTAVSAKYVKESGSKDIATLCSKECAELYGLKILENDVQDSLYNYTKFIVISKELKVVDGSDRISVMTSVPHEVGSLSKLLTRFSSLGLNLSKIESRPIPATDFEFLFYLDFYGNIKDESVLNLLAELDNSSIRFTFLGAYKEFL